jgi:hypothetical protein
MLLTKLKVPLAVLVAASVILLGGWSAHTPVQAVAAPPETASDIPARTADRPAEKPTKDVGRLEMVAAGNKVFVRIAGREETFEGEAERASYDEGKGLLVLEGKVRLRRKVGRGDEVIQCQKLLYSRTDNKLEVQGVDTLDDKRIGR